MEFKIEVNINDILEKASYNEKQRLYDELKDDYSEDLDDQVNWAFDSVKKRIFNNLVDEGFADYLLDDNQENLTIEDKRFMMDKEDETMLDYLIEKYKYFG